MKKILLALGLCLVTSAASAAPIVKVFLDNNAVAGTFQIRLEADAGDANGGIASYGIQLAPKEGTAVTALDHRSPRVGLAENAAGDMQGPVGFTLFRSADGAANLRVGASQDTIAPTPFLIYGFGTTPGSFGTVQNGPIPLGSTEGNNWTDSPVVVSGTYTSGGYMKIDRQSVETFVNVFTADGATTTMAAELQFIPEPGTLAMAGMGLVGMIAAARRRKA